MNANIPFPLIFGDYVRDVFRLVGFTDFHQVRMTSVMSASRDTQLAEAEKINSSIAKSLNKKLIYQF